MAGSTEWGGLVIGCIRKLATIAPPTSNFHADFCVCTQFPFTDNVYRAARSGVKYVACPTGSVADQDIFAACEKLNITFVEQSVRLVSQVL